jgi:hypothetical protein
MTRSRAPWLYRFVRDRTGQSEAVGVVLLVALTLTGSGVVVVYGAEAIRGTTQSTDIGQAEHAMTQLDSKASLVAHGSSDVQHVSVGRGQRGDVRLDEEAGWMRITNDSLASETTVMNVSMGAVVYERGETTVAYQGGGVWRRGPGGSTMVSPPEFHYRGRTLTLPLVLVRGGAGGNGLASGRLRLGQSGPPVGRYPTAASNRSNPLADGEISVTVGSEYYRAWAGFFRERTGGNVSLDHANETVTLDLVIPDVTDRVRGAVLSTGASDEIDLQGGGSFPAFVDSYNSSAGDYGSSQQDNGTIITTGGVEMGGNSEIEGSVRTGGAVSIDAASSTLTGTAYWTTGFSANPSSTWGDETQIDGVAVPDDTSSVTRSKVDNLSIDNDNGATGSVSGGRLQFGGGSVTLTPGDYYLDAIDASGGKKIIFDTNGGTVTVGVESDVALEDVDVSVQDGGSVRLYVKDDVDLGKGVSIDVPGDVAKRFWIYGTEGTTFDAQANQGNPISVVGVFYAPGDPGGGSADVSIKHAEIYGGVVAGDVDVETGGAVHYDESLAETEPFPVGVSVPRVTYLHVSTNRVNVTA